MTEGVTTGTVATATRTHTRNASLSINDIFDAIVELVTNADDRYQVLGRPGKIEIEIERRRKSQPAVLRVRDNADGMTHADMKLKLARIGERVSGMQEGAMVRGTNSRGAKDVATLGNVSFESIAQENGRFHKFELAPNLAYQLSASQEVTQAIRSRIGIPEGSGTLVSLTFNRKTTIPNHSNLRAKLSRLVALRNVLRDPQREIFLIDANHGSRVALEAPEQLGVRCLSETFDVDGYPGITAKLRLYRANRMPNQNQPKRFRTNWIEIVSTRAVHEATLFDSALERDPHAQRFYGRLVCPGIDEIERQFDDRAERQEPHTSKNPKPLIDPNRRTGLFRDHPFFEALRSEVVYRLNRLVDEERRRVEGEKATVESAKTRRRLDKLQHIAAKFIAGSAKDEIAQQEAGTSPSAPILKDGYQLTPPFSQLVVGDRRRFSFRVRKEVFPQLGAKSKISVDVNPRELQIEPGELAFTKDERDPSLLLCSWEVKALAPANATAVTARTDGIEAEAFVEVLEAEADRFRDVTEFGFRKSCYTMKPNAKRRKIQVHGPLAMFPKPQKLEVDADHPNFSVLGETLMRPKKHLGISRCDITVEAGDMEAVATLRAKAADRVAHTKVRSRAPLGSNLVIKLEDIDHGNQRYRYTGNVLEVAAKHPSISRYLGGKEDGFPGQDDKQFLAVLAEIVSDALCSRVLEHNEEANEEDFRDLDWNGYYSEWSKLMTRFLPIAHETLVH